MKNRDEDLEFMRDLRAAILRGPRLSAHLLLFAMIGFLVLGVYWASRAPLDEVTRGMGQVIPSGKVQVVQNLEGGIVSEIRVREGNIVKKGQTLVLIDNTQFLSKYGEDRAKYLGLRAAVARLTAEEEGRVPTFPSDVMKERPQLARNEMGLYKARQDELRSAINVIKRQVDQKKQELVELASLIDNLKASFALAEEEFDITEPMVKRGVTPRIQLVRLMREISDLRTTMVAAQQSVPRAQSALKEAERRIDERRALFRAEVLTQRNEAKVQSAALEELLNSAQDRLNRTEVRSPVNGTVKKLSVNTTGGVIKPGMDLVEIVPLEDNLLVEAKVRPADIAFLHPGQVAKVKITAYDYAVYGYLDAVVKNISADTILDEKGESFYQVRVRTKQNYLGNDEKKLPIIPGMIAEVDVLTGQKTVLDYFMKPILRARQIALTER